jgi:serine/threonine protein kinase/cytochrome c-type biogenesis protein CcmH/NrfG
MACLLRVGIGDEAEHDTDTAADQSKTTLEGFRQQDTLEGNARFGIYEIERRPDGSLYELGHGAMGTTYRAVDTALQREVALKIIKNDIDTRSVEARDRFLREARAAATLRHENIATVYQFGICEETGQLFYAMELVDGETLEERVGRAGPLDVRTTIDIAQQVASALVAAEKRGLVHRDLKPANLMLVSSEAETPGGVIATALRRRAGRDSTGASTQRGGYNKPGVKIIDFGLAKVLKAPADPMRLTHYGFIGTPAYASPEQFEHSALDARSDIYSLGATLWFALTGKTPFEGRDMEEIRRARQSNALPVEQLKAARVSSRLRLLLQSMLASEPAARPGTHDLAAQLQRCAAQASGTRRTRLGLAAAAILFLGGSAFVISYSLQNPASNQASKKSIAVLPFEDLNRDPENAIFSDGVHDDVLTKLAKIADLKVISRSSVLQYRGEHDLRQIGRALGVSHVLQATVRRSNERVRINAQLVDTRADTHVWADGYDRDLNELFAIETEIAQSVANRLSAKVSANERLALQERPTSDLVAYDFYIRATSLMDPALYYGLGGDQDLFKAVELLNQAVARDPAFLLAYCKLAQAHDGIYWRGLDRTPKRLELAKSAIDSAFRLNPDSSAARLASAQHFYNGYLDYDRARDELAIALRAMPNQARIFELGANIDRRQGRWHDAIRNFERAIDLDPQNSDLNFAAGFTYLCVRDYKRAREIADRGLALTSKTHYSRLLPTWIDFHERADTLPWHAVLEQIRAENPASAKDLTRGRFFVRLYERNPTAAESVLATLEYPVMGARSIGGVKFTPAYARGLIARMKGDMAAARAAFSAARDQLESAAQEFPDDGSKLCFLGLIDAALGRKDEALREGKAALDLLPLSKDALSGTELLYYYAVICAWTGESDLAIEHLKTLATLPAGVSYGEIGLDPHWDPLRGDPRFEEIVAGLAPK